MLPNKMTKTEMQAWYERELEFMRQDVAKADARANKAEGEAIELADHIQLAKEERDESGATIAMNELADLFEEIVPVPNQTGRQFEIVSAARLFC